MPTRRMKIYRKTKPFLYSITNPKQNALYKEVLSFDGGIAFASSDEVIVKKKDGTEFRSELRHYESDAFTETYIGRFPNGERFRFLFASSQNPISQLHPMVTFAGMSKTGWAVHFDVY